MIPPIAFGSRWVPNQTDTEVIVTECYWDAPFWMVQTTHGLWGLSDFLYDHEPVEPSS